MLPSFAEGLPVDEIPLVSLMGLRLARIDRWQLLDHLFATLASGRVGWLVTANLDFLRRYVVDASSRSLYDAADLRVADGMPLIWACKVQGTSLPGRVPGSSLVWLLVERAAREGRSLYLLGGTPEANVGAAKVFEEKYHGLKLCGWSCPMLGSRRRRQRSTRWWRSSSGAGPTFSWWHWDRPSRSN